MKTVSDVLAAAQRLIDAGDLVRAIKLLTMLLEQYPEQTDGRLLISHAQSILGEREAALLSAKIAVRHTPNSAQGFHNLASRTHESRHRPNTLKSLTIALALDPNHLAAVDYAHHLLQPGVSAEALSAATRALTLSRLDIGMLSRLAALDVSLFERDSAERLAHLFFAASPNAPEGISTAILLAAHSGQPWSALLKRYWSVLKESSSAALNVGILAVAEKVPGEAILPVGHHLNSVPASHEGALVAGRVCCELSRHDHGLKFTRRAIALLPDEGRLWRNYSAQLLAIGENDTAASITRQVSHLGIMPLEMESEALTILAYSATARDEDVFKAYQRWETERAQTLYASCLWRAEATPKDPKRPLKVGLVSADLHGHPIGVNLLGFFQQNNAKEFPLHVYSLNLRDDPIRSEIKSHVTLWRDMERASDKAVAAQIAEDGIDFLIHTAGHTVMNRPLISAYKPAPLIAAYGDFSTMGLKTVDYILSDPVLHPDDTSERMYEKPLRLPLMVIHAPLHGAPPVSDLPALHNGYVTFASFNNPAKLSEPCLAAWATILARVPNSRMLVQYKTLFGDPLVQRRIFEAFDREDVAHDRLQVISAKLSRYEHLALANQADIALDPFPFSGCTSTFEALWMGLPPITKAGSRWVHRMTASFLPPVGLEALVADSAEIYVTNAIALANELERLAEIRADLRNRVEASSLLDHAAYARSLERGIRQAWHRHCAGEPPAPITVAP